MSELPALISRRLLENYLQIPYGTLPDDVAAAAIHGSSDVVRDHCGWRLDYEAAYDVQLEGNGTRLLYLPTKRLINVDAVVVNGELWRERGAHPDYDYDYTVSKGMAAIRCRPDRLWPMDTGRISVDFTHGWPLTPYEPLDEAESPGSEGELVEALHIGLPGGLEKMILAVAGRSLSNPEGYSTVKVGGISETYAGAGIPTNFVISRAEQDQLAPYTISVP